MCIRVVINFTALILYNSGVIRLIITPPLPVMSNSFIDIIIKKPNIKCAVMKNDSDKPEDKNIIHFPKLEKRQRIEKNKKKDTQKDKQEQEALEQEYREQYRKERAARARMQTNMARNSAAGKQPFINWEKIPPFTRGAVALFLIIHLASTFLLDDAQRLELFMYFGFVPAYYTGAIAWSWTALIAPFTTLIIHGSWMHLLVNSVMMIAMGVFFERQFGAKATLKVFILSGLAGSLVYFLLNPTLSSPVVGASGAISGLFAAALMMMHLSGMAGQKAHKRGPFPFILLWITIMISVGLISDDTAWQSHLGGFLGGLGLFQLWRKGKIRF